MNAGVDTSCSDTLKEFELLKRLRERFDGVGGAASSPIPRGMGDDAAVLPAAAEGKYSLLTTDMLLEGTHFDLSYSPLESIGYKAVSVNVSDVVAMNGEAKYVVVALGATKRWGWQEIEALYVGIARACEEYGVQMVGGDTVHSQKSAVLSLTVLGEVDKAHVTYRSGAQAKDLLCVTGDLGAACVGTHLLIREKRTLLSNPELDPKVAQYARFVQRQLTPKARTDIVSFLRKENLVPHAMIDISDGLSSEILHLCEASQVGAKVYEERLVILDDTYRTSLEMGLQPLTCAMNGGEDYELLMALPPQHHKIIEQHPDIHIVGHTLSDKNDRHLVTKQGRQVPLQAQGWQHEMGGDDGMN